MAVDAGLLGIRLPGPSRQVNEDWLYHYRGWVYGAGFGLQLGLGFVTTVAISAVYVVFGSALLSASVAVGSIIGASFGIIRGSTLLAVAAVRRPEQIQSVGMGLSRLNEPSRRASITAELLIGVLAILIASLGRLSA